MMSFFTFELLYTFQNVIILSEFLLHVHHCRKSLHRHFSQFLPVNNPWTVTSVRTSGEIVPFSDMLQDEEMSTLSVAASTWSEMYPQC